MVVSGYPGLSISVKKKDDREGNIFPWKLTAHAENTHFIDHDGRCISGIISSGN